HKPIPLTHHNLLQAFPHAHTPAQKNPIKIIYPIKPILLHHPLPIPYKPTHTHLKQPTYVLFHVQTTPLSNQYHQIIQLP
ncbi:hypothetical protein, partial [Staphylococcus hominis]|uniref:hypothetical protein n=1 Tax=Staphylococcus hominis TaxID=1290 RepID=UPI001C92D180